jgi:ribosomal protein S6--L-glutamate ligase
MKVAILSRNPELYSTRRLVEAASERGHSVEVVDYLRCHINIAAERPTILFGGRPLEGVHAVIPRIGATYTFYGTAVVRQFEMTGVLTANSSLGISRSRDKLQCLQLLSQGGVGLPVTGFAHSPKDVESVINSVGGPPLVVKVLEGTQGIGVVLAENRTAAQSVFEAFRGMDANILVQEFIEEARGADLRCLVVDGRVVASMMRRAAPGEFRSNLHRGGTAEKVELTRPERRAACAAAGLVGLDVAGVDLLRSKNGPLVLEVNSSPGLEGIESATSVDVAGEIIAFMERRARLRSKAEPPKVLDSSGPSRPKPVPGTPQAPD